MYPNVAVYDYEVNPFFVDPEGEMTITSIINHLQLVAHMHADSCGWGFDALLKNKSRWVLARMAIEMKQYPKTYDQLSIATWVDDITRAFSSRNFEMKNQQGEILGYARSIWSVIDMETRKSIDLSEIAQNIQAYKSDKPCPIDRPRRPMNIQQTDPVKVPVKYADIDVNRHVNSTRYVEHILDLFPLNFHDEHDIERFDISYQSETLFGETLLIHTKETEPLSYAFEVGKESGNTACKAQIKFIRK
ncbi:MAG: acyl-[acyl-carrier-protein] thioesterase [Bacteroidales bacterium]